MAGKLLACAGPDSGAGLCTVALDVVVTVRVPQLAVEKTIVLPGLSSAAAASAALDSVARTCAALRQQHRCVAPGRAADEDHGGDTAALRVEDSSEAPPEGGFSRQTTPGFEASFAEHARLREDAERSRWEFQDLQLRYDRNLQSMARMRTAYLAQISALRQHVRLERRASAADKPLYFAPPKLGLLSPLDYVTPADLPEPVEKMVERIKARMELHWAEYSGEARAQIRLLGKRLSAAKASACGKEDPT